MADTLAPDRIVVGVTSGRAEQILRQLYARPLAGGAALIVTSLETAELAKAAANAFLATKISFINAMAEICEAAGGDVRDLAQILGADPRIGPAFLRAGLGYGGGCLPKDIRAFVARAEELGAGASLAFLREVDAINLRRRARTADLTHELAGGNLTGVPVCVLGAAFKPGSDDVRDSPALDVAQILTGMGARVTVYDPAALDNARRARPELSYAPDPGRRRPGRRRGAAAHRVAGVHRAHAGRLGGIVARRNIIDARNALDPVPWREAGWEYRALGVAEDAADPGAAGRLAVVGAGRGAAPARDGAPVVPSPYPDRPGQARFGQMKALVLAGGSGEPAAADHPHLRQATASGRQQAGPVLRARGHPGRRHHRRGDRGGGHRARDRGRGG